ncbi:MAG TPA: hypothetical protein VNU93_10065, partial [Verrucomicrobiae bacterium]|nr:hypothetical protein [Verrucomicrobiae bacterium]
MKTKSSDAAQMMKAMRARRRAEGLCPYCGEKNDRPGKYYCSSCAEQFNEYSAQYKSNRITSYICPRCGGDLDREGFTCIKCTAKVSASSAEIKRRYREQGLCDRCGKEPPKPGRKYCISCYQRDKTRRLERLETQPATS